MGGLEEGEMYFSPFLQGIEELLGTPSRNVVIEEVFQGDTNKVLEKGELNNGVEVEVARVLQ